MQWRNGRDIQGGRKSESPHDRSVLYVYMHSLHINIFNGSLTAWTVSSAAHLTFRGEIYQLIVMVQQRRQTQSHRLLKTVNQDVHTHYYFDHFFVTGISYIQKFLKKFSQFNCQ